MSTDKSIVIDANILIRAVLGKKVRDTIQILPQRHNFLPQISAMTML